MRSFLLGAPIEGSFNIPFKVEKKKIPYSSEVEWIGSTGSQFVLTDFIPLTFNWRVEWRGKNAVWGWIHNNVVSGTWLCGQFDDNYGYVFYGDFTKRHSTGGLSSLNSYDYVLDSTYGAWINDVYKGKSVVSIGDDSISTDLPLFANYDFYNDSYAFKSSESKPTTFEYFRLEGDGRQVLDLIPVRFTNDLGVSEGAMYDKVSGKLFTNQGAGSFIIGPDKV